MNKKILRPAIAMVELIFAIVIIGIALLSAPMLISTAAKSGYVAMQQEGINEAATKVNMIMGYHWDENNVDESFLAPILNTNNGDSSLDEVGTTGRRAGTPLVSQRTFIRADGQELNASAISDDGGTRDDVDDYNGDTNLLSIETARVNYVETTSININTVVTYLADTPGGGTYNDPGGDAKLTFSPDFSSSATPTTDIKKIVVTLTSTSGMDELEKTIILNGFSCNIGSYRLEDRVF